MGVWRLSRMEGKGKAAQCLYFPGHSLPPHDAIEGVGKAGKENSRKQAVQTLLRLRLSAHSALLPALQPQDQGQRRQAEY